jgi:hypothetical protein
MRRWVVTGGAYVTARQSRRAAYQHVDSLVRPHYHHRHHPSTLSLNTPSITVNHRQSPSNLTLNYHPHPLRHHQLLHSSRAILDVHHTRLSGQTLPPLLGKTQAFTPMETTLDCTVAVAKIGHHAIIHQDLNRLHNSMLYFTYVEENVPYR